MDSDTLDTGPAADDVVLRVPPYSEYLRTVRLVAADVASRGGLDYDEIEDFRIAVDELCHVLMRSTDHDVVITFAVTDTPRAGRAPARSVSARGWARRRAGAFAVVPDELSRRILESVTDSFSTSVLEDGVEFAMTKRPWTLSRQTERS